MSVGAPARATAIAAVAAPAFRVTAICLGLAGFVAARAAGPLTAPGAIVSGVGFGVGLLILARAAGLRAAGLRPVGPRPEGLRPTDVATSVGAGAFGGAVLVGLALMGRPATPPDTTPNALAGVAFPLWAIVTVLVATAEEAVLRGALFGAVHVWRGPITAVIVTAAAFALLHVPLYGWTVVPLDLAVGIWLGGLRLATGSFLAPAIAHVAADLATWWL